MMSAMGRPRRLSGPSGGAAHADALAVNAVSDAARHIVVRVEARTRCGWGQPAGGYLVLLALPLLCNRCTEPTLTKPFTLPRRALVRTSASTTLLAALAKSDVPKYFAPHCRHARSSLGAWRAQHPHVERRPHLAGS